MWSRVAAWFDLDRLYNWVGGASAVLAGFLGGWDAGRRVICPSQSSDDCRANR